MEMAGYGGEKICELRGQEVSWNGNNLQPGVIGLDKNTSLGRYYFQVRKTTGALESALVCQLISIFLCNYSHLCNT